MAFKSSFAQKLYNSQVQTTTARQPSDPRDGNERPNHLANISDTYNRFATPLSEYNFNTSKTGNIGLDTLQYDTVEHRNPYPTHSYDKKYEVTKFGEASTNPHFQPLAQASGTHNTLDVLTKGRHYQLQSQHACSFSENLDERSSIYQTIYQTGKLKNEETQEKDGLRATEENFRHSFRRGDLDLGSSSMNHEYQGRNKRLR